MSSELLTPQEVADELRIDYRTVLRMLKEGTLPHLDLGVKTKRIRRSALNEYLRQRGDSECS